MDERMHIYLSLLTLFCGILAPLASANTAKLERFVAPSLATTVPDITFTTAQDKTETLADYRGRIVILNLWATWCGPCVEEMPALDNLAKVLDPRRFAVLPVAVGRDDLSSVARFYGTNDINYLPALVEEQKSLTRKIRPRGLPLTLIIGREGQEISRVYGAVEWDSKEMVAMLTRLAE
jgi:thiol-disulfide isomerase/thioredoxin